MISNVWVTGGASGIGKATVKRLTGKGYRLLVTDINQDFLREVEDYPGVRAFCVDSRDASGMQGVFDEFSSELGGELRALINCAGINVQKRGLEELSAEDWQKIVDVNLNGTFHACRLALGAMRRQGFGSIVNVASWAAKYASPLTGAAYNASKRAVVALTESINMEAFKDGIRATVLLPEAVNTAILDKRKIVPSDLERSKMIQPEDMARVIEFVLDTPRHVCINELIVSPTWNTTFVK